jgi:hypothetical protein
MATTTAKIQFMSTDLVSDTLDLSTVMTLYTSGTTTGMSKTTGLARYSTATTSETKLLEAGDYTDSKAHKLYIKNTSTTRSEYVQITTGTIASGSTTIGRLYGGEWGLIPWHGASDINVIQSVTGITIEWMLFYE